MNPEQLKRLRELLPDLSHDKFNALVEELSDWMEGARRESYDEGYTDGQIDAQE